MRRFSLELSSAHHVGARDRQEDYFSLVTDTSPEFGEHGGQLLIVCDGMGSHARGDASSVLATQSFRDAYLAKTPEEGVPTALRRALTEANDAVRAFAEQNEVQGRPMGTTLLAAVVGDGGLFWLSVGDSDLYIFRKGGLFKLNRAHTYGEVLTERFYSGEISEVEAAEDPQWDALTSFVGQNQIEAIDARLKPFELQTGDRILLATDGLTRFLCDTAIAAELEDRHDAEASCNSLVGKVLESKHPQQDNITVILCDVENAAGNRAKQANTRWEPAPASGNRLLAGLAALLAIISVAVIVAIAILFYSKGLIPVLLPGPAR